MTDSRVIIFHKHPVSAKVRFLKQAYGGICGFEPLPALATVRDDDAHENDENVINHPAMIARQAEKLLQLEDGVLDVAGEYLQRVDVPHGLINVYLLGFTGHDTPDEDLARQDATFQLITGMRNLPPAEMELLRRAYVAIMEG